MPRIFPPQHLQPFELAAFPLPFVKEEQAYIRLKDLPRPCLTHVKKPPGFFKAFTSEHGTGKFDVTGLLFRLAHYFLPVLPCIVCVACGLVMLICFTMPSIRPPTEAGPEMALTSSHLWWAL